MSSQGLQTSQTTVIPRSLPESWHFKKESNEHDDLGQ